MEPVGCVNLIFWAFSCKFLVNFTFGLFPAVLCLKADTVYSAVPTYKSAISETKICWLYLVLFITLFSSIHDIIWFYIDKMSHFQGGILTYHRGKSDSSIPKD